MNFLKNFLIVVILISFFVINITANAAELKNSGITPDSSFYFLKIWEESIRIFFTFGLENKAKLYLHLVEVRFVEYQEIIRGGKIEIALKILEKYEKQLNQALVKLEELKQKNRETEDLTKNLEQIISGHIDVFLKNLIEYPKAKKGLRKAIESSVKVMEKIRNIKMIKQGEAPKWKNYRNERYSFELEYPETWILKVYSATSTPFLKEDIIIFYDPRIVNKEVIDNSLQNLWKGGFINLDIIRPSSTTPEQWVNKIVQGHKTGVIKDGSKFTEKQITGIGFKGIQLETNQRNLMAIVDMGVDFIEEYVNGYLYDSEKVFIFKLNYPFGKADNEYRNIYEHMLSTFKLIK